MLTNSIEQAKRFSEDSYATCDEIKALYNQNNVDDIWKNVLTYRSFYSIETELRDNNSLPYKITLTKKLSYKAYSFEIKLLNDFINYSSLTDEKKKEFFNQKLIDSISYTAKSISCTSSKETIRRLVENSIENIPADLFVLKAYMDSYLYAYKAKDINKKLIDEINSICCGEEKDSSPKYRNDNSIEILNPLKKCKVEDIENNLNNLINFLNQEDIPTILKALCIPYFFFSNRPYEFYNEETAAILTKAYLNLNGLSLFGFITNIESICYASSQSFFDRLSLVEKSLDLTYILNRFIQFLYSDEELTCAQLQELIIQDKENYAIANDIKVIERNDLALPHFPISDSNETIEARARKLKEIHPQLKRKQAHFYAGHCTIGLHYTIEQFKNIEHTVYETARTSMEDLANRGFYKKELIGKRFVYTPIPLSEEI